MRGLVLLILLFSLAFSGEDFEKICTEEVEKNDFNISLIRESCFETAKKYEIKNDKENAFWFYLLSQKYQKQLHQKEDEKSSFLFYVNHGHAYVLENNLTQAKLYYENVGILHPHITIKKNRQ